MADKEEKYFIHKIFDKGKSIRGDEFITFYNDYGVEFTRQEAIEKISFALMKAGLQEGCVYYAQAAINAILNNEENNNGTN